MMSAFDPTAGLTGPNAFVRRVRNYARERPWSPDWSVPSAPDQRGSSNAISAAFTGRIQSGRASCIATVPIWCVISLVTPTSIAIRTVGLAIGSFGRGTTIRSTTLGDRIVRSIGCIRTTIASMCSSA